MVLSWLDDDDDEHWVWMMAVRDSWRDYLRSIRKRQFVEGGDEQEDRTARGPQMPEPPRTISHARSPVHVAGAAIHRAL